MLWMYVVVWIANWLVHSTCKSRFICLNLGLAEVPMKWKKKHYLSVLLATRNPTYTKQKGWRHIAKITLVLFNALPSYPSFKNSECYVDAIRSIYCCNVWVCVMSAETPDFHTRLKPSTNQPCFRQGMRFLRWLLNFVALDRFAIQQLFN